MNAHHLLKQVALCLLLLVMSGCGGKDLKKWEQTGHVYPPDPDRIDIAPVHEPPEEKPIVRIISGEQFSGEDEARRRYLEDQDPPDLGLRTPVGLLALDEVPLIQVAAMLSEMTGYNIAVTREAATTPVSLFLQNLPLRQALEAICRLNGLWYREDERIVTLMTVAEYGQEMVIRRNEKSRAFWLRYSNANDMAKILQAVMGSQIVFNDIGTEEVYGHVDEDKEAGETISLGQAGGQGMDELTQTTGFSEEEMRRLASRLNLAGRSDALEMSRAIEKEVPAVITVFKRNNAIIARSLDETVLTDIGRIIELMDTPTSQVLLEIAILQLNLGDGFESFFQLNMPGSFSDDRPDNLQGGASRTITFADDPVGSTFGSSAGPSATTLNLLFGNANIEARLQLYEEEDRVEVLATPYLMSANNAKVEFFVGEEVPLRDDVESETLFNEAGNITTTTFEVTVNREELGTDIEVSSFINEDGTITMDLEAELSFPVFNLTTIGVVNEVTGEVVDFPLDGVDRSELNSIVTTVSGQPIAIGGIIRERLQEIEKKVPLLGDLPVVGFPFREIADERTKTETVILITPHIILHPAQTWQTGADFLKRRSSHPRLKHDQENLHDYPTGTDQQRPVEEEWPWK